MASTLEEAIRITQSMTNSALIDYCESKFNKYRKLGFEVHEYRSASAVYDGDDCIAFNKMSYHELKTIIETDKYLEREKKSEPMKAWLKDTDKTTRVQKTADGNYKDIYNGTMYTEDQIDL